MALPGLSVVCPSSCGSLTCFSLGSLYGFTLGSYSSTYLGSPEGSIEGTTGGNLEGMLICDLHGYLDRIEIGTKFCNETQFYHGKFIGTKIAAMDGISLGIYDGAALISLEG